MNFRMYQHSGFLFVVYFLTGVHYIMSNKFCQGPLENVFGRQHMAGGRTDNPTIPHFLKATPP